MPVFVFIALRDGHTIHLVTRPADAPVNPNNGKQRTLLALILLLMALTMRCYLQICLTQRIEFFYCSLDVPRPNTNNTTSTTTGAGPVDYQFHIIDGMESQLVGSPIPFLAEAQTRVRSNI